MRLLAFIRSWNMSHFDKFQWAGIVMKVKPMGLLRPWILKIWPIGSGATLRLKLSTKEVPSIGKIEQGDRIHLHLHRDGTEGVIDSIEVANELSTKKTADFGVLSYSGTYRVDAVLSSNGSHQLIKRGVASVHVVPNYIASGWFVLMVLGAEIGWTVNWELSKLV